MICSNKLSTSVTAVEVTRAGETVKINERHEVERDTMACLSKMFSLTYKNTRMKNDFTSQIGYLVKKWS